MLTGRDTIRWLLLLAIAPVLALSPLGGMRLLLHGHADHGEHAPAPFHVHFDRAHTDHTHAAHGDYPAGAPHHRHGHPGEPPCGVLVSIPDQDLSPARGGSCIPGVFGGAPIAWVNYALPRAPDLGRAPASPGGPPGGDAQCRQCATALARIVRLGSALTL